LAVLCVLGCSVKGQYEIDRAVFQATNGQENHPIAARRLKSFRPVHLNPNAVRNARVLTVDGRLVRVETTAPSALAIIGGTVCGVASVLMVEGGLAASQGPQCDPGAFLCFRDLFRETAIDLALWGGIPLAVVGITLWGASATEHPAEIAPTRQELK
jgi:hypothetical protein